MSTDGNVDVLLLLFFWFFLIIIIIVLQMPRNTFEEMKYLEIMIVSDHSMVGAPPRAAAINADSDVSL